MCPKHPESGGLVCGEFVCGACYGEALLSEPYRPARPLPPLPDMTMVGGHKLPSRNASRVDSHEKMVVRTGGECRRSDEKERTA